jgi:hypothetical protein
MASTPGKADEAAIWKRCSTCRGPIDFATIYYVCSVSTCNRPRTTYRFCTVECWEEHLPLMRHREAWAVEETSPTQVEWAAQESGVAAPTAPVRPTAEVAKVEDGAPAPQPIAPKPVTAATLAPAPLDAGAPRRRIRVGSAPRPAAAAPVGPAAPAVGSDDVLVVASRFKTYVRERFGMNTSDAVLDVLSDHLRAICHRAAENARADGRKTVMDRDFEFLKRRPG